MEKQDSFQALLSMSPELKKAYDTLLPEDISKHLHKEALTYLQESIKTFIRTLIINSILKDFIQITRSDISMYVSDILNLQSTEKLKKHLMSLYNKQGVKISEEEAENMIENMDIYIKQVIDNIQGENNG